MPLWYQHARKADISAADRRESLRRSAAGSLLLRVEHFKFVAHAPHRAQVPLVGNAVQLFTQALDVYVDGSGFAEIVESPHLVEQLIAGVDLARVGSQMVEQLQLFGRRVNRAAADAQLIVGQVDRQVVVADLTSFPPVFIFERRSTALMRAMTSLVSKGFTM